jgi:RNA-directed DNA polymerase
VPRRTREPVAIRGPQLVARESYRKAPQYVCQVVGGVNAPLLANVALHELDRLWEDHSRHLGQLVRYADDFVIICRTEVAAREALRRVGVILARLGLRLHPDKTRVVDVRDGRYGFDFLGFQHQKVESWRWRAKRYLQ